METIWKNTGDGRTILRWIRCRCDELDSLLLARLCGSAVLLPVHHIAISAITRFCPAQQHVSAAIKHQLPGGKIAGSIPSAPRLPVSSPGRAHRGPRPTHSVLISTRFTTSQSHSLPLYWQIIIIFIYTGKTKNMEMGRHQGMTANEHVRIGSNFYKKKVKPLNI